VIVDNNLVSGTLLSNLPLPVAAGFSSISSVVPKKGQGVVDAEY
jgi:hypothetical protein